MYVHLLAVQFTPAFYTNWFLRTLEEGENQKRNYRTRLQESRVVGTAKTPIKTERARESKYRLH